MTVIVGQVPFALAVRDRLQAMATPPLVLVAGGAGLEAIQGDITPVSGSVYVIPGGDTAKEARGTGAHRQEVSVVATVALAVQSSEDDGGEGTLAAAETWTAAIAGALAGWTPDPATREPVNYSGSHPPTVSASGLWWYVSVWTWKTFLTNP